MDDKPLGPASPRKTTTLCEALFFGGDHSWPRGTAPCPIRRRQKPPYQHKWTAYHEWKNGKCIHCKQSQTAVKIKPKKTDKCTYCHKTREELARMRRFGDQPELGCEEFGHEVERRWSLPEKKPKGVRVIKKLAHLKLVVDNTRNNRARHS